MSNPFGCAVGARAKVSAVAFPSVAAGGWTRVPVVRVNRDIQTLFHAASAFPCSRSAVLCGHTAHFKFPQGASCLSFFDDVEETEVRPPTTARRPRGRNSGTRSGGSRGPGGRRPPGGGRRPPTEEQAIRVRRGVALVALVI